MNEAPTIIGSVGGWEHLSGNGKAHYALVMQKGLPVISHKGDKGVAVHSSCCETLLGHVEGEASLQLQKWMDKGVVFTAAVHEPPFVQYHNGAILRVLRELEVKFTPLPSIKQKQETKVEEKV